MTISNTFQEEYDMAAIQGFLGYFGKLAELPASYNRLQAEMEALNAKLTEVVEQVRVLTSQVSDKTKALEEAQAELRHTSDWLKASRESNTLLREQLRTQGTTIAQHQTERAKLQDVIQAHEATVVDHAATIDRHARTIHDQRQEIAQLKARIARMVAVANGQDEPVPTVDQVVQEIQFHEVQSQEVSAHPLGLVDPDVGFGSTQVEESSGTDKATSQSPVTVEYSPREEEALGGVSSLPPFRPFATTTGPSGDHHPSQSSPGARRDAPDGRYDPDLDPRYNFA